VVVGVEDGPERFVSGICKDKLSVSLCPAFPTVVNFDSFSQVERGGGWGRKAFFFFGVLEGDFACCGLNSYAGVIACFRWPEFPL